MYGSEIIDIFIGEVVVNGNYFCIIVNIKKLGNIEYNIVFCISFDNICMLFL